MNRNTETLQERLAGTTKNIVVFAITLAMLASLALTGCSPGGSASSSGGITTSPITTTATGETSTTRDSTGRVSIESDASVMDSYDWTFSDRDLDYSYDESTATNLMLSDAGTTVDGAGAAVSGSAITISEEGVYIVSGTLGDGSISVDLADDTAKVQIALAGVDITCSNGPAILVENADKVFITLAEGSENTLNDGSVHDLGADENNHDGVIFSHDDLTLNGVGTLTVNGNYDNGIVGKNDVRITSGTYIVNAVGHGIQGKDCIKIIGGDFTITSGADAFHASNDEDDMLGYLGVGGGTFAIAAGDDAFHAESALLIAGGTIDITQSYEGYEGRTISITGGVSTVVSNDDGVNAATGDNLADDQGFMGQRMWGNGAGGRAVDTTVEDSSTQQAVLSADDQATVSQSALVASDCFFEMTGGFLYVKAGGDGLDSNGALTISGGEAFVECVAAGGNGAIDCDSGATITGGLFGSIGPSDMAQGFSTGSTQASIILNAQAANTADKAFTVTDSAGNEVYSFTPVTSNRSFVVSTPDLVEGETYTIASNGQSLGTASAALDTQGSGMGGRGGTMPKR